MPAVTRSDGSTEATGIDVDVVQVNVEDTKGRTRSAAVTLLGKIVDVRNAGVGSDITGCCTSVDVERGDVTVVSDIDGERDVYPLFRVKHSAKHDKKSAPALRVQDPVALVLARGSHLYSDHLTASSEYGPTSSGIPIATVRAEEVGASGFGTFGDVIAGDLCAVFSGFPVHTAEVIEEGAMDMIVDRRHSLLPEGREPDEREGGKDVRAVGPVRDDRRRVLRDLGRRHADRR